MLTAHAPRTLRSDMNGFQLMGLFADHAGCLDEVARVTEAAMRGEIPLEDVYGRRLELVRPSREQVEALGERYVRTLVTDARETIAALLAEGIEVRVMSGGIRQAVVPLAIALGLTERAVAAVDVHFTSAGEYAGFDQASPLARSGGKRTVLERWLPELPRPIMLVGDGATDLEARPPADTFVAFAGVVERPAVIDAAAGEMRLPQSRTLAAVGENAFASVPEALGALYSFEVQQPATAQSKLAGEERVRAALPNPDLVLPAGMFMHVEVVLEERPAVIPSELRATDPKPDHPAIPVADDLAGTLLG